MIFSKTVATMLAAAIYLSSTLQAATPPILLPKGPQEIHLLKDENKAIAGGKMSDVEYTLVGKNGITSHFFVTTSVIETEKQYTVFIDVRVTKTRAEISETNRKTVMFYGTKGTVENGIRNDELTSVEFDRFGNKTTNTVPMRVDMAAMAHAPKIGTLEAIKWAVDNRLNSPTSPVGSVTATAQVYQVQSWLCVLACTALCSGLFGLGPEMVIAVADCIAVCTATDCQGAMN